MLAIAVSPSPPLKAAYAAWADCLLSWAPIGDPFVEVSADIGRVSVPSSTRMMQRRHSGPRCRGRSSLLRPVRRHYTRRGDGAGNRRVTAPGGGATPGPEGAVAPATRWAYGRMMRRHLALAALVAVACAGSLGTADAFAASPKATSAKRAFATTFVGRLKGSNAYVAVLKDGRKVGGYVCNDGPGGEWIQYSRLRRGRASLRSAAGDVVGRVRVHG